MAVHCHHHCTDIKSSPDKRGWRLDSANAISVSRVWKIAEAPRRSPSELSSQLRVYFAAVRRETWTVKYGKDISDLILANMLRLWITPCLQRLNYKSVCRWIPNALSLFKIATYFLEKCRWIVAERETIFGVELMNSLLHGYYIAMRSGAMGQSRT